jgi:hypothetical protein
MEYPSTLQMHTDKNLGKELILFKVSDWVNYACLDAELTFYLYYVLSRNLRSMDIEFESMTDLF